ncbi:MAG TPA: DegT/DnrJ/EryC1/StrS family aminotransferase [Candidatus Nanoarchaeia archaeon]|nr:DegT/DnrJ/EryC1/StrS family aminotransferase [Candidatus Nanoarchaeia archaeon]
MKRRFIPVCEPTLRGNELKYVSDCVKTNWVSSFGKYIGEFEKGFSAYCGVNHGITCCNGSIAIHLALESAGIGPGDEVIVPDFTMIASVNSILYTGAKPVFVDAEMSTWCMNSNLIEEKITKRTKAILPVHIYGHPVDMDKVIKIVKQNNLLIIEDAAEAHGALYKGKKCGSLSDASAFSFFANKIITCGEGGMVLTNDDKIADKARLLKNYAFTKQRYVSEEIGYNYRMTNMQAAIGLAQLEKIDELVECRISNAHLYNNLLSSIKGVITPPCAEWAKNVYWMYGILIDEKFGMGRDKLREKLLEAGIDTRAFFVPMHLQPVYNKPNNKFSNLPDTKGKFPVSEYLGNNGFYLPSSSHLTKDNIIYIADTIKSAKEENEK